MTKKGCMDLVMAVLAIIGFVTVVYLATLFGAPRIFELLARLDGPEVLIVTATPMPGATVEALVAPTLAPTVTPAILPAVVSVTPTPVGVITSDAYAAAAAAASALAGIQFYDLSCSGQHQTTVVLATAGVSLADCQGMGTISVPTGRSTIILSTTPATLTARAQLLLGGEFEHYVLTLSMLGATNSTSISLRAAAGSVLGSAVVSGTVQGGSLNGAGLIPLARYDQQVVWVLEVNASTPTNIALDQGDRRILQNILTVPGV